MTAEYQRITLFLILHLMQSGNPYTPRLKLIDEPLIYEPSRLLKFKQIECQYSISEYRVQRIL